MVTYTGANEHTGQPRPPAVPLGELLDALDRTTDAPVRDSDRRGQHPLQPFDSKNLEPGRLGTAGPFTFDPTALVAAPGRGRLPAAAARVPRRAAGAAGGPTTSALADLLAFFRDPVKGFFRSPRPDPAVGGRRHLRRDAGRDRQPGEVVGRRPDAARHAGRHPPRRGRSRRSGAAACCRRAGSAGAPATEIREQAMQLAIERSPDRQVRARRRSTSTSTSAVAGGSPAPSRASTADRLVSVELLPARRQAAAGRLDPAARAVAPTTTTTTGRRWPSAGRRSGATPRPGCSGRSEPTPAPLLADLVAVYDAGRAGAAAAAAEDVLRAGRRRGRPRDDPVAAAGRPVATESSYDGENADPAHVRVWGANAPPRPFCRAAPAAARSAPGETTRLGAYAARVWEPMLRFEQSERRDGALRPARRRCPPAPPCSRPAPAPARPTRSPAWSPATSPRAPRRSTRCC